MIHPNPNQVGLFIFTSSRFFLIIRAIYPLNLNIFLLVFFLSISQRSRFQRLGVLISKRYWILIVEFRGFVVRRVIWSTFFLFFVSVVSCYRHRLCRVSISESITISSSRQVESVGPKLWRMDSGSTSANPAGRRGRVYGIPEKCWCGSVILEKISQTKANPFRRYYKCAYAFELRLENDSHCFKWVDEAHRDEIRSLESKLRLLNEEVNMLRTGGNEEKFELIKMQIETVVLKRVEEIKMNKESEARSSLTSCFTSCFM